jgi:hypothetical protein
VRREPPLQVLAWPGRSDPSLQRGASEVWRSSLGGALAAAAAAVLWLLSLDPKGLGGAPGLARAARR